MKSATRTAYNAANAAILDGNLGVAADILAAAQNSVRFTELGDAAIGDAAIAMIRKNHGADLASVLTGEMNIRAQALLAAA